MKAYVNHGRWVVDCPHCNSGVLSPPGVMLVQCLGCSQWIEPEHPNHWAEIEAALRMRPKEHRNWQEGESIMGLILENLEHGVPV